jgi:hypothetical protein
MTGEPAEVGTVVRTLTETGTGHWTPHPNGPQAPPPFFDAYFLRVDYDPESPWHRLVPADRAGEWPKNAFTWEQLVKGAAHVDVIAKGPTRSAS